MLLSKTNFMLENKIIDGWAYGAIELHNVDPTKFQPLRQVYNTSDPRN